MTADEHRKEIEQVLHACYGDRAPRVTDVTDNGSYKIEGSNVWRVLPSQVRRDRERRRANFTN